jgi:hypothetical protein
MVPVYSMPNILFLRQHIKFIQYLIKKNLHGTDISFLILKVIPLNATKNIWLLLRNTKIQGEIKTKVQWANETKMVQVIKKYVF